MDDGTGTPPGGPPEPGAPRVPAGDVERADVPVARGEAVDDDVVARARPPLGAMKLMAFVAAVTAPLAVLAAVQGDVLLGVVALVSAGWAGSMAYVGWTASSVADGEGVTVRWMRHTESVRWAEVREVAIDRSGPGGTRRGARFLLHGDRSLPWTPWVAFFWFAHVAANRSVEDLARVVDRAGLGPITDPGAAEGDGAGGGAGGGVGGGHRSD